MASKASPPDISSRLDRSEPLQVLVVEDDESVRNVVMRFVRREGYSVEGVEDGASALGLVAVKRPEAIILDLKMPVMDGYEFMERLALEMGRWRPRIIVLSASERLDLVRARFDADAYIQKPFDPERMRAALRRLVRPVVRPTP
jgi:CheY-like chemotaxis protein